jgi:co-chaperonin GroES (HSP10)
MPNVAMKHDIDPRDVILKNLGNVLDDFEICADEVLVATYRRREKTASGFYLPRKTLEEDLFQSKCGLVVKIGTQCVFPNVKIALHDWIVMRPSDGWACEILTAIEAVHCRMIQAKYIRAKVPHPELVW